MRRHNRNRRSNLPIESLESRRLMASVITVLNTDDAGAGSLRAAIAAATDGDTIDFAPTVVGELALSSELTISDDITITGPGAGLLGISGAGATRVLSIASGANVTLADLSIVNGAGTDFGAGIYNNGSLTLNRVEVSGNQANQYGGGIYNDLGDLTLSNSSISGNSVVADLMTGQAGGGGLFSFGGSGGTVTIANSTFADNAVVYDATGGSFFSGVAAFGGAIALYGSGDVTLTNSTFSANLANSYTGDDGDTNSSQDAHGGGIYSVATGNISLVNCTIANNRAGSFSGDGDTPDSAGGAVSAGGGAYFDASSAASVTNTLFSNNVAVDAPDVASFGDVTFQNSLITDGTGALGATDNLNGNLVGTAANKIDAKLAALAANGGPTLTRALLVGSPAVDAGLAAGAPTADQRGTARTTHPDIGAYEAGSLNAVPSFTSTPVTTGTSGQLYTYEVSAADTDGNDIIISASQLPAWLTLTGTGAGTATLSGTPTNEYAGANEVRLVVADGADSREQIFNVTVTAVNRTPVLPATPSATPAVANTPFSFVISGSDPDNQLLSFAVVSKPDWLNLIDNANNTATLTGTPTAVDGGLNQIVIQVSDGEFAAQQVFDIDVAVPRWTFDNGVLGINGDALDNNIMVYPIQNSMLRVVRDGVIKNFNLADVTAVEIYGYDGNDFISVNTRTIPAYVLGGAGADTLVGGDEVDNFVGGGGKDFLDAGGNNDRLDGGNGNDVLWGGSGDDRLLGGDGNDKLVGNLGFDDLRGDAGDDQLYTRGDATADTLLGGDGDDFAESDFMVDFHTDDFTAIVTVATALS